MSGTSWSTTEGKFVKWIEKLVKRIDDQGLEKLYAKGSPRRD